MKKRMVDIAGCVLFAWMFFSCAHLDAVPGPQLARERIERSVELEQKGELAAALQQIRVALTIDPANQTAREMQGRIRSELARRADARIRKGKALDRQGQYGRARKAYLTALRLRPDDPEALAQLTRRTRIRADHYVAHVIQPGESLSKIARLYYGDRKQFDLIARYNELDDATAVRVGQTIRIPQVRELPFLAGHAALVSEQQEKPAGEAGGEEVDQVAIYRDHGIDLFNRREYQEAMVEFEKVLGARPDDRKAMEYAFRSRYEISKTLFEEKQYLQAMEGFQSCLKLKRDCRKCHGYLQQSEAAYKELHYRRGMEFFDQQLLAEAIHAWGLVRERDPEYKRIQYLIRKAEKIQQKLDELKQKKQ